MPARDWLTTLWPASYNGFPFFFENDKEAGGRAIVVHEFPRRDDPFNEDLGALARLYEGSAYLASDSADSDAVAFTELLCSVGPGILVVPTRGPVNVRCTHVERESARDKLGYIAFSVKFVREGAAVPLVTLALAGQQVFANVDSLAVVLANAFPNRLTVDDQPQYVVAAAVSEAEAAVAALDLARTSNTVDPVISATIRDANAALVNAAPQLITPSPASVPPPPLSGEGGEGAASSLLASVPAIEGSFTDPRSVFAASLIATARALALGMGAEAAVGAMLAVAQGFAPIGSAPSYLSPGAESAAENTQAVADLMRLAALGAWAEALQRRPYTSRPQGVTARAEAAERFEFEMERASEQGAAGVDLFVALSNLRGAVVAYLTRLINDLAPVIAVSANDTMPGLWWAWRLYADPSREVDLVLRNDVVDPLFMPGNFAALSPDYVAPAGLPTVWPAP